AIPIAAVLVAIIMNASNGQLGSDISTLLVKFDGGHSNFAEVMISASVVFIAMIGMFIGFFASGLKKIAKFDPFIILWLCMLPILIWGSQVGMPWYLLPAMPAVGVVIAVGAFDKKMKFDKFASFVFAFLILMTLAIVVYYYSSVAAGPQYEKEAGQYLAGKDNVMVAGYYAPGLLFYKYNIDSKTKNICTIVTGLKGANNTFGAQADGPAKSADDVVLGAYFAPPGSDEYDNRWTDAFWDKRPLKIGCGGFEPEYLAAVGLQPGTVAKMGNFTLVDNASGEILIYKKSG
ncbi:MAG TPA: hypothetical protein PLO51_04945, partial [Candidatus Micrarchaeota archaeon]|nr:hypothetical protein [Candidatus Micrarchaeota archaeon]